MTGPEPRGRKSDSERRLLKAQKGAKKPTGAAGRKISHAGLALVATKGS